MADATRQSQSAGGDAAEIALMINGAAHGVRAATLADVLEALGYGGQKVATAVNGDFVPERMRAQTRVRAGDHIEIVSARQGG